MKADKYYANNLLRVFIDPYENMPLLYKKKAMYTVVISLIIMLQILLTYPIRLYTEGFNIKIFIEVISIFTLFSVGILLIRSGKLEIAINVLILGGFLRAEMLFAQKTIIQFYPMTMLIILATALCYIKRYQLIVLSVFYPLVYLLKIYFMWSEYKSSTITVFTFTQYIYPFIFLIVFLAVVHFLMRIIDEEIRKSNELAESQAKILKYTKELEHLNNQLVEQASTDKLTGILNRRKFEEILNLEYEKPIRYGNKLSLIFFDIDYFKKINDLYGHKYGDKILQDVTKVVFETIRKSDYFARWGGDEFMVLCNSENGAEMAERIRKNIENAGLGKGDKVTVSLGVVEIKPEDTVDKLLVACDKALYRAKEYGRNRFIEG